MRNMLLDILEKLDSENEDDRLRFLLIFKDNNLIKQFIRRVFYEPFNMPPIEFYCAGNGSTYTTLDRTVMLIEKYIGLSLPDDKIKEQAEKLLSVLPIDEATVFCDYINNEYSFKNLTKRFIDIALPGEFE